MSKNFRMPDGGTLRTRSARRRSARGARVASVVTKGSLLDVRAVGNRRSLIARAPCTLVVHPSGDRGQRTVSRAISAPYLTLEASLARCVFRKARSAGSGWS
jgi:hypothetical protein